MMGSMWLIVFLVLALVGAIIWIALLIHRDSLDNERRKRAGLRRCVYCAHDLRASSHRCPECGRVQPIRCSHCGQIIMNGLSDHGPHCPMVVGAADLEDAVEQA